MPRNPFAGMTVADVERHNARVAAEKKGVMLPPPLTDDLMERRANTPKSKPGTLESLNKTERRFYDWLKGRSFDHIGIQDITLRLGFDLRYNPDFTTVEKCAPFGYRTFLWEVKGFMRDDARVKLHAAAKQFPFFDFRLVRWNRSRQDWDIEAVRT